MNLSYLSICSGLGGAPLALNPEGFHEVACAEIEPFCAALLDHRFGSGRPWRMPDPDAEGLTDDARRERRAAIRAVAHLEPTAMGGNAPPNLGDFTQIRPKELPPVDMLIGGTPCQAFSFAGLRRGMADARGNLTLAFVELAHGLAETNGTRCALWENVPGVLSDDDNAFGCFLGAFVGADDPLLPSARPRSGKGNDHWRLDEKKGWIPRWPSAGMVAGPRARAAWIIRNAQYFGVPQRRERVFLVVDLGGGPDPAAVLFERKGLRGHSGARGKARKDVAGPVKASAARRSGREDNGDGTSLIPEAVYLGNAEVGAEDAPFLTASNLGKTVNNQTPLVGEPVMFKPSHYTRDKDGAPATVAPPLSADADKGDQDAVLLAPIAFDARQSDVCVYGDQAAPLDTDGWTQAMQSGGMGEERGLFPNAIPHTFDQNWVVRRLLPVECERLQGVPDNWTDVPWRGKDHAPDGPRHRAIGNGWATPVVAWLGGRIRENWPTPAPAQ